MFATIILLNLVACGGANEGVTEDVDDIRIIELTIEGYDIDFDAEKTGTYIVGVESNIDTITLNFDYDETAFEASYQIRNSKDLIVEDIDTKTLTLNLEGGVNDFLIKLLDPDTAFSIIYVFQLTKPETTASVLSYVMRSSQNSTSNLVFEPIFEANLYDYSVNVAYENCSVTSEIFANSYSTEINYDGVVIEEGELHTHSLIPGINVINTFVSSEDGSDVKRYSVEVNRALPRDDQLDANANLSSLNITNMDIDYNCGINSYVMQINSNLTQFEVVAQAEVEGAKIYINNQVIPSGEAYTFEAHDQLFAFTLKVVSADESFEQEYNLLFSRLDRNVIEVDTSEELKSALENALPNDEIRIAEGIYSNSDNLYDDNVEFFSDQSGTSHSPIVLIAASSSDEVVFTSSRNNTTLLKIKGDYWNISGIDFENSASALVLEDASHNNLRNMKINAIETNAINIMGGSINNEISDIVFADIGKVDENVQPVSAISIVGAEDAKAIGNVIRYNTFSDAAGYTAVSINEYSTNVTIENNIIQNLDEELAEDFESLSAMDISAISTSGNDTTIRYNNFNFPYGHSFDALIDVKADETNPGDAEVFVGEIYHNLFNPIDDSSIGIRITGEATVLTYENTSLNDLPIIQEGAVFEDTVDVDPVFSIHLSRDDVKCLDVTLQTDFDDPLLPDIDEIYAVSLEACSDSATQHWSYEAHDSGYVYIRNKGVSSAQYLRPIYHYQSSCIVGNEQSFLYLGEKNTDWISQWRIDTEDGITLLKNRQNPDFVATIPGTTSSPGSVVMACPLRNSDQQVFELRDAR
ncbi:MAG: hypothetical protein ACI93R_001367 [Flavobacteriales bacterium]